MTTKTFGRRGAADAPRMTRPLVRPAAAATVPTAVLDRGPAPSAAVTTVAERNLIADIPFLTAGLILLLMIIFGLEKKLAFDVGRDGHLSVQSLAAFGAVSRDLVIGSGEWWRITLAPLLHASVSHLVGNCFALAFVGWRLEPMIGRGWFALIFMISALGGVAGSLLGNPPDIVSVGASGAITGLIGALFVVSFSHRVEATDQRAMLKTAAFFGVPALLPLVIASSSSAGGTDYFAHAGGAIAGGALALVLCAMWSTGAARPEFARRASMAALVGFALSIVCAGIAATRYSTYRAEAAQFIPTVEMPATLKAGAKRAAELVARYPKDPRAHLIQAFAFVEANRLADAEAQLRSAMALAPQGAVGRPIRNQAQAILALVVLDQGRRGEAKTLAAPTCSAKDQAAMRRDLAQAQLCD